MNKKKEISEELKEIAPNLSNLKNKQDAFKLPDTYFANFEANLLQQMQEEVIPIRPKKRNLFKITSILRKLAAIFILGGVGLFLWQQNSPSSIDATLSSEEIASYIADNMDEFEEDPLLEETYISQAIMEENVAKTENDIGIEDLLEELEEADLEDLL